MILQVVMGMRETIPAGKRKDKAKEEGGSSKVNETISRVTIHVSRIACHCFC